MKSTFILFSLLLIAPATQGQFYKANLSMDAAASTKVYKYKNLQLYPVRANQVFVAHYRSLGNYETLQEGLKKKKVLITEHVNDPSSSGGTVNTLYIENVSSDTVMVLSGEVVQGGKQDRVISQDFLLYPHSGKKDVAVFCVEAGRWVSEGGDGAKFEKYYGVSSNTVRKAATVTKDQQAVWDKVAETTQKNKAGSTTGALAALKSSEDLNKDLASYISYFEKLLIPEADVIGVVAVSGDAILGCDLFASHEMFANNYKNLLGAYATEAITFGKDVKVSREEVSEYLDAIIGDERNQDKEVEKKGTILKDGKRKLHISTFN
jgi:hypothetical protein